MQIDQLAKQRKDHLDKARAARAYPCTNLVHRAIYILRGPRSNDTPMVTTTPST